MAGICPSATTLPDVVASARHRTAAELRGGRRRAGHPGGKHRAEPTALLEEAAMFTVSALKRFAASSKDVLVLVDGSKNRFTTVFPLNAGTFLMGRSEISLKDSA